MQFVCRHLSARVFVVSPRAVIVVFSDCVSVIVLFARFLFLEVIVSLVYDARG